MSTRTVYDAVAFVRNSLANMDTVFPDVVSSVREENKEGLFIDLFAESNGTPKSKYVIT